MKSIIFTLLTVFLVNTIYAQSVKIPIEKRKGHLYSKWKINGDIDANVFLESGFPIIVISEQFIKTHQKELTLKLNVPLEDEFVRTWNDTNKQKVVYHVNETILINGKLQLIDAVVIDFSDIKAWRNYDIVYPVLYLTGKVEINIKQKYMCLLDTLIVDNFTVYEMEKDSVTNSLFINSSLSVYDTLGTKENISGNFMFDLGSGNAFMLNKNSEKVKLFVEKSDRMVMKNTKMSKDISVIMPLKIGINNIIVEKSYVVAMYYKSKSADKFIGNIGNSFFKEFVVIFDYENNKIYLKPNSDNIIMSK